MKRKYWCWCPELGVDVDDGSEFETVAAWEAAEAWAKFYDDEPGHDIATKGLSPVVHVRDPLSDMVHTFEVTGERTRSYNAMAVT